jgi:hypothetical protein
VTAQSDRHASALDLAESLSRAYFTALHLLGDASRAETLVIEAVDCLDPEAITSSAIRDAVVRHLVRAQMG